MSKAATAAQLIMIHAATARSKISNHVMTIQPFHSQKLSDRRLMFGFLESIRHPHSTLSETPRLFSHHAKVFVSFRHAADRRGLISFMAPGAPGKGKENADDGNKH